MKFKGTEVYEVLAGREVTHLHHANSVTTSCAFLQLKGLASRGCVETSALAQTIQESDALDKKYGIWDDVFTDGVDVHYRGGKKRGANLYGPVLFKLPVSVLRTLPPGSVVMVARKNPVHWRDGEPDSERYFETVAQLKADPELGGYRHGDFGQHIVIRTPSGILPFGMSPVPIELDDPKQRPNGKDAYAAASTRLKAAATRAGLAIEITQHRCKVGCLCVTNYATADLAKLF